MFSSLSKKSLARASLFKDVPVYVQFYITARCNLTCQQCNIIYANSDVRECGIDEIKVIADNLAELGTAIVLLTGGEPFIRKDIHEIVHAFESRGIHVRMQTNGFASEAQIEKVIEAGGRDISISLDSLNPATQDHINGDFDHSWHKALKTISLFTKYLPSENSFASFGCVIQRDNIADIEDVIRFGSRIGWYSSVVPVHTTDYNHPRGFRTFDSSQKFLPGEYEAVDELLLRIKGLREAGYLLYDSDQYLDDISRFVRGEKTTWRSKNKGVCDSPNLYFAILPNGDLAPCCDYRMVNPIQTQSDDFVTEYKSASARKEIYDIVSKCPSCMYGSYPEMSISMRFLAAKLQRIQTFFTRPPEKPWPFEYEELIEICHSIIGAEHEPLHLPSSLNHIKVKNV
jgi:MoaA/NifB/PqqE/SkfB family radical SAM enzyme